MNKIEIKNNTISSGQTEKYFVIDGHPLYEYIDKWIEGNEELLQVVSPTNELAICWSDEYDFKGDSEFVRFALNQNKAIIPILLNSTRFCVDNTINNAKRFFAPMTLTFLA